MTVISEWFICPS